MKLALFLEALSKLEPDRKLPMTAGELYLLLMDMDPETEIRTFPAEVLTAYVKTINVDLDRCTTTCSNGSRCVLPLNHHPADRHETDGCPCVAYDPPARRP